MHSNNTIHRDLKPENILLSGENLQISICDFGFALDLKSNETNESNIICGTPGYIAPEVFKNTTYSEKSDIFAVGCILYNLISRENLFIKDTLNKTVLYN